MAWIENIWQHPRTSAAGLLIATATVAGVLSQQGITLGTAGTGTVVSLIAALATALLGLLSKDPGESTSGTKSKFGAGLIVAVLIPALTLSGCTITANQLKNDAAALAAALTSLSAAVSPSDASAAAKLALAAESLNAVVNQWDASSSIGLLNTVAAGAETALAGISSTSKYAALVAIAVGAIDVILANTNTTKARALTLSHAESDRLVVARATARKAVAHRLGRSPEGDFKAAWNHVIDESSLPVQKLR
jgi:hypothetical protein